MRYQNCRVTMKQQTIIKMWETCRRDRHDSWIRTGARGISPGIFARRRDGRTGVFVVMATAGFHRLIDPPRSRSSTKPQSGRSAGGHTPADEGSSPISSFMRLDIIGGNRILLGFLQKKMQHVRDRGNSLFFLSLEKISSQFV